MVKEERLKGKDKHRISLYPIRRPHEKNIPRLSLLTFSPHPSLSPAESRREKLKSSFKGGSCLFPQARRDLMSLKAKLRL